MESGFVHTAVDIYCYQLFRLRPGEPPLGKSIEIKHTFRGRMFTITRNGLRVQARYKIAKQAVTIFNLSKRTNYILNSSAPNAPVDTSHCIRAAQLFD